MEAALPLKARDEGAPPIQATLQLCPITDFFFEQYGSFERLAPVGIVYDTAFIGFIRGAYLPHHESWSHPHASPVRGYLTGYPPTLIASGTAERSMTSLLTLLACMIGTWFAPSFRN